MNQTSTAQVANESSEISHDDTRGERRIASGAARDALLHQSNESDGRERIVIREATQCDNEALLELTRLTPMAGVISLRIDRSPDFFSLLRARGIPIVYIAVIAGEVIGCMSAVVHRAYISGTVETVAHVGDLKLHPRFSGTRVSLRLIATIGKRLRDESIDLCMSLMADGNRRALRLTDGKHGTPAVLPLGCFCVDQLLPLPFRRRSRKFRVTVAEENEYTEIVSLLNEQSLRRSFGVPLDECDLRQRVSTYGELCFRKVLLVREAGRLIATLTVEDTQDLRQNVLIGLPWSLRLVLQALRVPAWFMPNFSAPAIGKPLKTLYVRFMACLDGAEGALQELIAEARFEAFHQGFTFVSIGLHERDPLRAALGSAIRVSFASRALGTNLLSPGRVAEVAQAVPFEDFALV